MQIDDDVLVLLVVVQLKLRRLVVLPVKMVCAAMGASLQYAELK